MELVDKIALALCGYGLPGEPCEAPCEFCLGQADAVMKVVMDEDEDFAREMANEEAGIVQSFANLCLSLENRENPSRRWLSLQVTRKQVCTDGVTNTHNLLPL